jgi:hypothetical protein
MTLEYGIPEKAGKSNLRVGRLNLICTYNEEEFNIWRKATTALKELAPVTRDFAVEFIHNMRTKECQKQTQ